MLKEMYKRTNEKVNKLYEMVVNEGQVVKHWDTIKSECENVLLKNNVNKRERYKFMNGLSQILRTTLGIDRVEKIDIHNFDRAKKLTDEIMKTFEEVR